MKLLLITWLCVLVACGYSNTEIKKNNELINNKNMANTDSTNYYIRKYDPKTGVEIYNSNAIKRSNTSSFMLHTIEGGIIVIYEMNNTHVSYEEYPAKKFYKIQRQFYPNGMLKQECFLYRENLKFGIWKYYDEKGNLSQEINEDEKFEKSEIQIDDVLHFLDKIGWLNLKTGEGQAEINMEYYGVVIREPAFWLSFYEEKGIPYWFASQMEGHTVVSYKINGLTGESNILKQKFEFEK